MSTEQDEQNDRESRMDTMGESSDSRTAKTGSATPATSTVADWSDDHVYAVNARWAHLQHPPCLACDEAGLLPSRAIVCYVHGPVVNAELSSERDTAEQLFANVARELMTLRAAVMSFIAAYDNKYDVSAEIAAMDSALSPAAGDASGVDAGRLDPGAETRIDITFDSSPSDGSVSVVSEGNGEVLYDGRQERVVLARPVDGRQRGGGVTALAKPEKGTATAERRQRSAKLRYQERQAKEKVRRMDGYRSRWPTERPNRHLSLEVDHHDNKKMGGDKTGAKSDLYNLITLGMRSHKGPRSVHSGHLRVETLTEKGTRGPCAFWERDDEVGGTGFTEWRLVGRERAVGLLEAAPDRPI